MLKFSIAKSLMVFYKCHETYEMLTFVCVIISEELP